METDKKALSRLKFVIDSNVWINAFHCEEEQLKEQCKYAVFIAKKEGVIIGSDNTLQDLIRGLDKMINKKGLSLKKRNEILEYFKNNTEMVAEVVALDMVGKKLTGKRVSENTSLEIVGDKILLERVSDKTPQREISPEMAGKEISFDTYVTLFEKELKPCDDRDDWRFLSLAHEHEADYLITCDHKVLDVKNYQDVKVLPPEEFIKEMQFREQRNTEKKTENSLPPEPDELLKELKADFEEKYKDFWKKNQENKLTDTDFHEVYYAAASVIQREVIVNGVSREEALAKHKYEGEYVKNYEAKRELKHSEAKTGRESSVPVVEPAKKGSELPRDAGIMKSQNKTNDKGRGSGGDMSI
jgi:predicted nucleic acid-binding protein